jgi:acyl dehydratase
MAKVGTPYDLEAVRKEWIGKRTPVADGRYPVEYDPIRRYCHMVEDRNPLFLDPEYAGKARHGAVIAPPTMTDYFAGQGAWPRGDAGPNLMLQIPTPGDRLINLNNEQEYLRPIKVGDRLSSYMEITDIYIKPIRLDPMATWIVTETRILNQDGVLVAIGRNTLCTHRAPEEVESDEAGAGRNT